MSLISRETGRKVLIAGVAVEYLNLLKFFLLPPKSGEELYPLLGEEPVKPAHQQLYYAFIAILGTSRLACLVKTPSFPLWLLSFTIHVFELILFNYQAQQLKKTKPLNMAQKGFLYVIWMLPLSQLMVRDFE